jgi:hypothetical protein
MRKDFFIRQLDDIIKDYKQIKNRAQWGDLSDISDDELSTLM